MRTRLLMALVATFGVAGAAWTGEASAQSGEKPRVIEVKMVDKSPTSFAFEPANVTVRPGDVLRFRQIGAMPHNVEFREPPEGADLDSIQVGPFLVTRGQVYELKIDERFVAGQYPFVCTPHEQMGMTGLLKVEPETRK
ncbi:MAG: plastocyanin/azurin family copper-binding protein [Gemmatimonadota bacterium]